MPGQECPQSPGRVLGIGEGTLNNVQRLMVGSANLNQMRAEIKMVVSTVASMINANTGTHSQNKSGVYWIIDTKRFTRIYCRDSEEVSRRDYMLYCSSQKSDKEMSLIDVVEAHQSLEGFLEWAMDLYPELRAQLKPIFEAAEL